MILPHLVLDLDLSTRFCFRVVDRPVTEAY